MQIEDELINSKSSVIFYLIKIIFILFIFIVAFLIWRIYEKTLTKKSSLPTTCINQDAYCILNFSEVSPIWIKWNIEAGDIKIIAWDEVISWKEVQFQINTSSIYKNISFVIPEWTNYFASKKWKKLYHISNSKKLSTISSSNLLFFKSLEEGNKAWFSL